MNRYLTKNEISEIFGISLPKIDRDMKKGLPYYKINRLVRFKQDEVENFYVKKGE